MIFRQIPALAICALMALSANANASLSLTDGLTYDAILTGNTTAGLQFLNFPAPLTLNFDGVTDNITPILIPGIPLPFQIQTTELLTNNPDGSQTVSIGLSTTSPELLPGSTGPAIFDISNFATGTGPYAISDVSVTRTTNGSDFEITNFLNGGGLGVVRGDGTAADPLVFGFSIFQTDLVGTNALSLEFTANQVPEPLSIAVWSTLLVMGTVVGWRERRNRNS